MGYGQWISKVARQYMVEESIKKFSLTRLLCISLQGPGANINRIDRNLIYIYNVTTRMTKVAEDKIYSKAVYDVL